MKYKLKNCWLSCWLLLSSAAVAQERCISLVTSAGGQSFWGQVRQAAHATAAEMQLPLHARGPARDGDTQTQLELIERMLKFNCRVLIVAPSGPEVGVRMAQLRAQGVTGLYIDRDLDDGAVLASIATDNYGAGRQAGREMARALGGQGSVALLRLSPQVASTSSRERGFLDGARDAGLRIAIDRYLPLSDSQAMLALGEELRAVDGLFTPSEATTLEMLATLRRLGLAGKRAHIGFDASSILVDALERGELVGLMVQQPRQIGVESVIRAHRVLDGDLEGPRQVRLPAVYVNKDNFDDETVRRLLMP